MAKIPKPVTVDFETFGIEGRPHYPPIPVGVSIKYPGKKPHYFSFGHIDENNCSWSEAKKELEKAWAHHDGICFQNGKFDIDVGEVHFGLPIPKWDRIHDTLFLLFLHDPHQIELGLKKSSERLLGMAPEEQDEICDWLIQNQPVPGVKISKSRNSQHYFGRYIALAPSKLVGKYANGDVDRTEKLFVFLYKDIVSRNMLEAYDRERKLMPILLEMERQGVAVGHARLRTDAKFYSEWHDKLTVWVKKRIKAGDDINLKSGEQLVNAMVKSGCADPDLIPLTPTGKYQTNKEALLVGVTDKVLLGVLKYMTQLSTCLNTFMIPWLETADKSGGLIYTTWNQTKTPSGDSNVGTRTGRLSSTPNFQNIPKEFNAIFQHDEIDKEKKKKLPKCPFNDLPALPIVRSYVVPFKGEILIDRDYSQQEPRILAHFDGGSLMERYNAEPWIDFHDFAKAELELMGKFYDRKPVKNTNLGLIYGMGAGKLAVKNDMAVEEAGDLKKAILTLYPGLKDMYAEMKARAKNNIPVRTWGGREYYCEPPRLVQGRMRQFDYKLVNVLIQGSAADCTKEAIIRFHDVKRPEWKIVLNVHDEIVVSVPNKKSHIVESMGALKECMHSVEFDVPMLSEGDTSSTNWAELKTYDKKGVEV